MVYQLGTFSSFNVEEEVNFRDNFYVYSLRDKSLFLESKDYINYNDVNYGLCAHLVSKYQLTKDILDKGIYILNIAYIPSIDSVKKETLKSILIHNIKAFNYTPSNTEDIEFIKMFITSVDLFKYGLVLPLFSNINIRLNDAELKALEAYEINLINVQTIQYQFNSLSYLKDYFDLVIGLLINDLDNDIKEYVFSNLIK